MSKKYDIGIIGETIYDDYGLIASYLGLYEYIKKIGYKVVIIPPAYKKNYCKTSLSLFQSLCECGKKFKMIDYSKNNENIHTYILGCGALWDYTEHFGVDADQISYLNFVSDDCKRISYGTTFKEEFPTLLINRPDKNDEYKTLLHKFDSISVAAKTDVEILKDYYDINNAITVIDSIFLPKRDYWKNFISNKKYNENDEIVLYPLNTVSRIETLNKTAAELKVDTCKIATGNPFNCQELMDKSIVLDNVEFANPPSNPMDFKKWLEKIYNCKYLMCADFYSLCFALIFSKNFIVFKNEEDKRIDYLIQKMGIQDRVVENYDNEKIVKLFKTPINHKKILEKIVEYRKESMIWLVNKLKNTMKK